MTDQRTPHQVSLCAAPASAAHACAAELLTACATPYGLLASTVDELNYRRIWARDGLIAAIGAAAADLAGADDWLDHTLQTLAHAQGPAGQIPSNVTLDAPANISYGTAALRIDATLWFLIGAGVLGRRRSLAHCIEKAVPKARALLRAWEGNERGLLYTPRAGNWADEYPVHGYTLYDNVLRLWAESEAQSIVGDDTAGRRLLLTTAVETTFFMSSNTAAATHVPAFVAPGERSPRICTLGLAIAALVFDANAQTSIARVAMTSLHAIAAAHEHGALLPAYSPVITPDDEEWPILHALADYGFRNAPGRYHNGGLWPMVNGFAAAAFRRHGDVKMADAITDAISAANSRAAFPEYIDANTGEGAGTRNMAWSAAAEYWATAGGAVARPVQ